MSKMPQKTRSASPSVSTVKAPFFYPTYSGIDLLPMSQSPSQLASWFSSYHPEYELSAWSFYGYLGDPNIDDQIGFSLNQQMYLPAVPGTNDLPTGLENAVNTWEHEARFSEASLAFNALSMTPRPGTPPGEPIGWALGGSFEFSDQATFRIQDSPFAAVTHDFGSADFDLTSLKQDAPQSVSSLSLVSGTFGQPGAQYMMTAEKSMWQNLYSANPATNTPTSDQGRLQCSILLQDRWGVISQGNSSAGFAPQFIGKDRQKTIQTEYAKSLTQYLEATQDPLTGLGVYSYSIPFLDVLHYDMVYTFAGKEYLRKTGKGGNIWADLIVGTTNPSVVVAEANLKGNATKATAHAAWNFFAIPLRKLGLCITTTQFSVNNSDNSDVVHYLWANVVNTDPNHQNAKLRNGAFKPVAMRVQDQAKSKFVESEYWRSPFGKKNRYGLEFKINLQDFEEMPDLDIRLTLKAKSKNQEVYFAPKPAPGKPVAPIAEKYEGMFEVKGTIKGLPGHPEEIHVTDEIAWGELAPTARDN